MLFSPKCVLKNQNLVVAVVTAAIIKPFYAVTVFYCSFGFFRFSHGKFLSFSFCLNDPKRNILG